MYERMTGTTSPLVRSLEAGVTAVRAGRNSSIPSLGSDSQLRRDMEVYLDRRDGRLPSLPDRLNVLDLAVLIALAATYGDSMLSDADLGDVLRIIAHLGSFDFLQRVLWGETIGDRHLAERLNQASGALVRVTELFPTVSLTEANLVLALFRVGPRGQGPKGQAR